MSKFIALFVVAAALAGGYALSSAPPPPPLAPLDSRDVILAFGDSLTLGTGASRGQNYPTQLAALIGREVVASGVRGEKSEGALRRFAAELRRVRPALVIVCTGGNDFLRKVDEMKTEENLREMTAIAKREKIPMILVAVPRASLLSYIIPLNHPMFARVAADAGLWLEDAALKKILSTPAMTSADTIHPNELGYLEMAKTIADLLRRAGAV